jgi:hypothetical protein
LELSGVNAFYSLEETKGRPMETVFRAFTAVLVIAFILIAMLYMVNPKRGAELLKGLVIVLLAATVGMCLLAPLVRSLAGSAWFPMLLLAATVVAYFIRKSRRGRPAKDSGQPWGAERTPVLPNGFDKESD